MPDEIMQGWPVHIRQTSQPNPANPLTVLLCDYGNDHLAQSQSARGSPSFHAPPISFIHLDYALQTIPSQTSITRRSLWSIARVVRWLPSPKTRCNPSALTPPFWLVIYNIAVNQVASGSLVS